MRARALTFSFLTSLSVLRQEHRFPNTLFLCPRTFSFALGPPRPLSCFFFPRSLSLSLSPSQNLTISLTFRCSGANGGGSTFTFPLSPRVELTSSNRLCSFRVNVSPKRTLINEAHASQSTLHLMLRIESDPVVHT